MSKEREVVNVSGKSNPFEGLSRDQIKAKLATVLERGLIADRLEVPLPPDVYGEWVTNDPLEIYRMESMGFQIDTEYAKQRKLHDGGDSTSRVGDVIFMTCPKVVHEIMEEHRRDLYNRNNNPKRSKEESDFKALADNNDTPTIAKSKTDIVGAEQIKESIKST